MGEESFRPLVDDTSKGFQTASVAKEAPDNFSPLRFQSEESEEAPFEAAAPPEPAPEPEEPPISFDDEGFSPMEPPEEVPTVPEAPLPETPDPGGLEVERQAFEMGLEKGEREGFLKGEERAMEMLVRLENLIAGFEGAWKKSCRQREEALVALTLAVVEKVVFDRASRDDELAARSLVEALATMEEPGRCTVRVHPEDFASVERLRADLFQRVANLNDITILPDPVVEEGEVRIESDGGWLETSVQKRLDETVSRMREAAQRSFS